MCRSAEWMLRCRASRSECPLNCRSREEHPLKDIVMAFGLLMFCSLVQLCASVSNMRVQGLGAMCGHYFLVHRAQILLLSNACVSTR